MLVETEFDMLSRLLQIQGDRLTPEGAHFLLSMEFAEADQDRVRILGEKANSGQLSSEERAEYERYIRVDNLLSIMKSKARLLLKTIGQTA